MGLLRGYSIFPIRKTFVPHVGHVPFTAGRPFFSVVSLGSLMSLFAFIDGTVQPIPFQIDEINQDGKWVLPGIPASAKKKRDKKRIDKDIRIST